MTPERYQQIKAIYQAALERGADERAPFVAQVCGNDDELRAEVESLLAAEFEKDGFVDSGGVKAMLPALPSFATSADTSAPTESERATQPLPLRQEDKRIGPYRLIREIGHGGMGSVYLAERADREFNQRVALKLIKRGMDTDEIIARFRHERQILAALDHPNIARLLDGGTTTEGLPYFVMEHVEGVPLDDYCTAHNLTLPERLELFRTVCSAVHYAHQNLVIHRDLKPANILVTSEGVPKLLDFGIAKVLNPALMSDTLLPTATSARPMTPAYASPEQVRGQAITTASDVYALGVILYEVLTGQRPYEIKGKEFAEVAQIVCESVPSRPSTVQLEKKRNDETGKTTEPVSPSRRLSFSPAQLRGDLDNIVLMALRKEPLRRYASVEQFSEDLRRHLAGLPVIAREDTFRYRVGKFVQRNRLAVMAASIIAILLLSFLVTTLIQSRRIARERDNAQLARENAEQVSQFLLNLFKVNDPNEAKGRQVTARELLDKSAANLATELKDQPARQATMMDAIGTVYFQLGMNEQALPLLEQALQRRRVTLGAEHQEVADSLNHLGTLYHGIGKLPEAEKYLSEALVLTEKLRGRQSAEAMALVNNLGQVTSEKGQKDQAEKLLRESLAWRREHLSADDPAVASSLNNLGLLLKEKGDLVGAEPLLREALASNQRLYGAEHTNVATAATNLGVLLFAKGDWAAAEPYYRQALETNRKLRGNEHLDTLLAMNNYAFLLSNLGELTAATPLYREALSLQLKLAGDNITTVAMTSNLAACLREQGDRAAAEALQREAETKFIKLQGTQHPNYARIQSGWALLWRDQGKLGAAAQLFRDILAQQTKRGGTQEPSFAQHQHNLAWTLLAGGQPGEAENLFRAAQSLRERRLGVAHYETVGTIIGLGSALTESGKMAEAEPLLRQGLETLRVKLPKGHPRIAEAAAALGHYLARQKNYSAAEPLFTEAWQIIKTRRDFTALRVLMTMLQFHQASGATQLAAQDRVALKAFR